ncbi:hypothetical protein BHS06_33300 [Myxococcus xanthus]|nr:hypothetical protein BHS06_33300 [Myxococcus xanthus]
MLGGVSLPNVRRVRRPSTMDSNVVTCRLVYPRFSDQLKRESSRTSRSIFASSVLGAFVIIRHCSHAAMGYSPERVHIYTSIKPFVEDDEDSIRTHLQTEGM